MQTANVVNLRPRGPVTDREIVQLAAADFEAWRPVPDECTPQNLLKACDLPAYLCYALMLRPKADLVAFLLDVGIEQQDALASEIAAGAEKLRSIAATMDAAVARIAVAAASIATRTPA